ncbi:pheromone A receptor-domain-containing protein [Multifurca ochricompacta]|uniref:Pheromone A receptor-domain-containing protein n=1 Tax=Multifurca ochricompacta TaxID=376703 RepID=A0AAD4M2G2_9AGAM|nr:pheromone A receptor-domain-containing protein [Multifurca ochricompacta]
MRFELSTFSFLSVALLILILPGQVNAYSIPSVSIIAWLFFCNLIHGVNSVLWSGNQAVHAPVWCDITSLVIFGSMIALPGSFLCISRRLEAITSIRRVDQKQGRVYHAIFEAIMCFLLPALYMSLHTIVQDRRFVILKDLGCQAAVHNSLPALILVWLPPLCISVISAFYCLSAIINVGKHHYNSRHYFPSGPEMTLSLFVRRTFFAISGMLYVAVIYVYSLSGIMSSGLLPWESVSQTRSQISHIEILPSPSQVSIQSELVWWFIPVWSLLLCILSALGEETQRGHRSMCTRLSQLLHRDALPMHMKSSAKKATVPVHSLKSGWDHDLDLSSPIGSFRTKRFFQKAESTRTSTPSPTHSPGGTTTFTQSTLNALASSTAQRLPLPSPPPINRLQGYLPVVFPPNKPPADTLAVPKAVTDVDSIMSASPTGSIFSAESWPRPPLTIPSSVLPPATTGFPRPSSPLSIRSSLGSTIVDALGAIPAHLRDAPFNVDGPGSTAVPVSQLPHDRMQHHLPTRREARKKEVIYMTVVHETVDGF